MANQLQIFMPGDIWWCWVPYLDEANRKKRPVVVICGHRGGPSDSDKVLVIAPMTTFSGGGKKTSSDFLVPADASTKLNPNKKGYVRARRFQPAVPDQMISKIGAIDDQMFKQILLEYTALLSTAIKQ